LNCTHLQETQKGKDHSLARKYGGLFAKVEGQGVYSAQARILRVEVVTALAVWKKGNDGNDMGENQST